MSEARASTPALIGLACFGLAVYAAAELSVSPVNAEAYEKKLVAVQLMQRAEKAIRDAKADRGVDVDARNDPHVSGLIGPQFTMITTDRGAQRAKALAAHPNFAAAVTQMMLRAGVKPGDRVAVGMTGSLPGLNIAVLSACKACGTEPVIITSVGASMFGATDPEMTWLDMESVLVDEGLWRWRSIAASFGGGGDSGRGLSPAGRELIMDATRRNNVPLIDSPSLLEAVKTRVALYDRAASASGRPIKLYINVGGGAASLGGEQNARLIPSGLTKKLAKRTYPDRGVINVMADRGTPVIHLLRVRQLAREYDIDDDPASPVEPGRGLLFVQYRYNLWIVGASAVALLIANLVMLRLDLRRRLIGQPHPERIATT